MLWHKGPNYLNILVLYRHTIYVNPHFLNRLKYYLNR